MRPVEPRVEPAARASLLDVDWRFLLPPAPNGSFRRLVLLGGSEAVAERLGAVGLAETVALGPGGEPADAVVCLHDAGVALGEAVALLDGRGVLYYESRRRRLGPSLGRIRQSVERLGLSPVALYWVHPGFEGWRTYFPLDVRHAVEWYADSLHGAGGPAALAVALARRATGLDPGRLARLAPRVALVASRGADAPGPPLRAAELPAELRAGELRQLVLVRGDEGSRVIALPFSPDSRKPLAAVKIHRSPPPVDQQDDEQSTLTAIRQRLDSTMRSTLPEPLGVIRSGGVVAAVESFLAGRPLHASWARRRLPLAELIDDLDRTTDWLSELQLQSRVELRPFGGRELERWLDAPAQEYERAFGFTAAESRLLELVRERTREALGAPVAIVWQHSDLSSLNVLKDGAQVRVLDWESAALAPPLDDLLYFVTRWLYRLRDATIEETSAGRVRAATAFRQLFLEPGRGDAELEAARGAINRYVRALEIDERLVPALSLRPWLRRATGRLRRQTTPGYSDVPVPRLRVRPPLAADPSDPRSDNRYVAQVGILAEQPERWVAAPTGSATR
jgi:aminoglycoside phosphotransferase (APT) family kinase protein